MGDTDELGWPFAAGPDAGPAIVLVHGSSECGTMWREQAAGLRENYRVVAPDLPGHGRRRGERFTVEGALATLDDAVARVGQGRALLVGHSLGGYVAMLYAERRPEHVAGLALDGCSVAFRGWTGRLTRLSALTYDALVRVCGERAMAAYLARRPAGRTPMRGAVGGGLGEDGRNAAVWGQTLLAIVDRDFRAVLGGYGGPVLVITGEHDRYNQRTKWEQADAARDARLRTIWGAGHDCAQEQPDAYTRAIREFAAEIGWGVRAADEAGSAVGGVRAGAAGEGTPA